MTVVWWLANCKPESATEFFAVAGGKFVWVNCNVGP